MPNVYLRSADALLTALRREGADIDRVALERDLGQPLDGTPIEHVHAVAVALWHVYAQILAAEDRMPHPSLKPAPLPVVVVPDDVSSLTGPVT